MAGFEILAGNQDQDKQNGPTIDFLLESKTVGLSILQGRHLTNDKDDFLYLGQNGGEQLISRVSMRIMLSQKIDQEILNEINRSIDQNREFFDSLRSRIHAGAAETGYLIADAGHAILGLSLIHI